MFKNVQRELNELLILVRQTATYEAGLVLDPATAAMKAQLRNMNVSSPGSAT